MRVTISSTVYAANKESYDYSCVYFPLPESAAKRIISWANKNIKDSDVYDVKGYGREVDMHITIKYGLHTTNIKDIENVLKTVKPFDISLGEISIFSNDDKPYDVLKIEINSDKLHSLHEKFSKLDNTEEWRTYKPHATISYIEKDSCKNLVGNDQFSGESYSVDNVVFSSRTGKKTNLEIPAWIG